MPKANKRPASDSVDAERAKRTKRAKWERLTRQEQLQKRQDKNDHLVLKVLSAVVSKRPASLDQATAVGYRVAALAQALDETHTLHNSTQEGSIGEWKQDKNQKWFTHIDTPCLRKAVFCHSADIADTKELWQKGTRVSFLLVCDRNRWKAIRVRLQQCDRDRQTDWQNAEHSRVLFFIGEAHRRRPFCCSCNPKSHHSPECADIAITSDSYLISHSPHLEDVAASGTACVLCVTRADITGDKIKKVSTRTHTYTQTHTQTRTQTRTHARARM